MSLLYASEVFYKTSEMKMECVTVIEQLRDKQINQKKYHNILKFIWYNGYLKHLVFPKKFGMLKHFMQKKEHSVTFLLQCFFLNIIRYQSEFSKAETLGICD